MFDDAHTPVDTQTLVAWLDRIASQHTANRIAAGEELSPEIQDAYQQLETLRAVLLGQATTESAHATLRLLIAGGVAHWRAPAGVESGDGANLLIQELLVAALWPLVMTPEMPPGWQSAVQEIASPVVRRLMVELRERGKYATHVELAQRLAKGIVRRPYAAGISNLLEDMRDEQRGGAARSALLTIRDGQRPPTASTIKALLWWTLTSAGVGNIGNHIDDWIFAPFWERDVQQTTTHADAESVVSGAPASSLPLESAWTYINKGNQQRALNNNDQAILEYTEAIRLDPSAATAFHNRGIAYEHKAAYDQAIADYTAALKLEPDNKEYNASYMRCLPKLSNGALLQRDPSQSVLIRFFRRRSRNRR